MIKRLYTDNFKSLVKDAGAPAPDASSSWVQSVWTATLCSTSSMRRRGGPSSVAECLGALTNQTGSRPTRSNRSPWATACR